METIFVYACISLKKKIIEYWYYQFFFSFLSIHYVPSAYLYPTRGKFSNCVTKIAMAYNNGKSCIFSNCLSTAQIKQHLKNRLFETTNTLFISNQNLKMVSDNQWIVWNKTIISLFQTVYWLFQTMFLKCGFTTVSHMVWTTRFFPELWMLSSPLRRREWKGAETSWVGKILTFNYLMRKHLRCLNWCKKRITNAKERIMTMKKFCCLDQCVKCHYLLM